MHSNTDTNSLLASVEKPSRHSDFFDDEISDSDDETLNSVSQNISVIFFKFLILESKQPAGRS